MAMTYNVRKRILDNNENPALMGSNGGKATARNNARRKAEKEAKEREATRAASTWYMNDRDW